MAYFLALYVYVIRASGSLNIFVILIHVFATPIWASTFFYKPHHHRRMLQKIQTFFSEDFYTFPSLAAN